jgi:vacuolar-type H+-ATPase subunit C/Vma6
VATDYTYIVARLRALEADMPDTAWFQRLARSSPGGLVTMMREHYRGFEKVTSIEDFETGLEAEQSAFLLLLSSLIDDPATLAFIRSEYDFDNALYAWKAKNWGGEPLTSDSGLVDKELLTKAVEDQDRKLLPDHLRDFLEEIELSGEKDEPALVQSAGEAMKYRFLLGIAPGAEAGEYIRMRIDLMNIKMLIRSKRSKLRSTEPDRGFLEGGSIDRALTGRLLKESEEDIYAFLRISDYRRLLDLGLGAETPLWRADDAFRLFLLEKLGESRLRFFDLSPVLFHIELRDRNEHIARTVLVGKLNGMPEDWILERVQALLPSWTGRGKGQ